MRQLNANLQIVVAFRMLPEAIWMMPKYGTFNLHASLLPQYRGAAPINWAIINGELETGVTTFILNKEIDTGSILFQKKIKIKKGVSAGELHDILMIDGAYLVLKTTKSISSGNFTLTEQSVAVSKNMALKPAPKIFKKDCHIKWSMPAKTILNRINGLSPYPGAYTMIKSDEQDSIQLKIYAAEYKISDHNFNIGHIISDGKTKLEIACADGYILLSNVQLAGKKRMKTETFLRGFLIKEGWIAE